MQEYRFYMIGRDGRIQAAEELVCQSDEEALYKATAISTNCSAIEVWSGKRKVTTIPVIPLPSRA